MKLPREFHKFQSMKVYFAKFNKSSNTRKLLMKIFSSKKFSLKNGKGNEKKLGRVLGYLNIPSLLLFFYFLMSKNIYPMVALWWSQPPRLFPSPKL